MNRLRAVKVYAAVSASLPAASILIWPSLLWVHAVFVIWLAAAAVLWVAVERKENAQRLDTTVQSLQKSAIRTLNHHRHDWMNDVQIIYGYIRMGKLDKAVLCVEKMRDKMTAESRISRLGVPSLVTFFQSFRTFSPSMMLEIELDEALDFDQLTLDRQAIAEVLIDIINAYRHQVRSGGGDPAVLKISMVRVEDHLKVEIQFAGDIIDGDGLQHTLQQRLGGTPLQTASLNVQHLLLQAKLSA